MANVKNQRGEFVAEFAYNPEGKMAANKMAANNPGYTVTDARERSINAGVQEYRYGGPVSEQFGGETQPGGPYDPNEQHWVPWGTPLPASSNTPAIDSRPKRVPSLDSSPQPGRLPQSGPRKSFNPSPRTVPTYKASKGIQKRRRFPKGK